MIISVMLILAGLWCMYALIRQADATTDDVSFKLIVGIVTLVTAGCLGLTNEVSFLSTAWLGPLSTKAVEFLGIQTAVMLMMAWLVVITPQPKR